MVAIKDQDCSIPGGSVNLFDGDWEALIQFLEEDDTKNRKDSAIAIVAHQIASQSLSAEEENFIAHSNEMAELIGSEKSDSFSTDDSYFSLHSEFDFLDENFSFNEPSCDDSSSSHNDVDNGYNDDTVQRLVVCNERREYSCQFEQNHTRDARNSELISYAQLIIDPEGNSLVTIMEIVDEIEREPRRHAGVICLNHKQTNHNPKKATLDWPLSNEQGLGNDEYRKCQDETLSTEHSSLSSETHGKHCDNSNNLGDDWLFSTTQSEPLFPTRFSNEPIIFSHRDEINKELCWLDETGIDLYLLEGSNDPWDCESSPRVNARCGNSLKRLFAAPRLCISLPHFGELKWRAYKHNQRALDLLCCGRRHVKTKFEGASYSTLYDL